MEASVVALIGFAGALIGAFVTVLLPRKLDERRSARKADDARKAAEEAKTAAQLVLTHLGISNGNGTVVEMLEKALGRGAVHARNDSIRFDAIFNHLGIPDPPGVVDEATV